MKRTSQLLSFFLVFMMLFATAMPANAALQSAGPVDPVTTLPTYYMDTASLPLMPCLDQNGFCILPPPFDALTVPTVPITVNGPITDANFPGESFYYSADALLPIEAGELARLTFVLEAAFLGGVIQNAGTTFLRTDLQKMQNLASNATYRVTHPYGVFEFTTDAAGNTTGGGGVAVRQEDGSGSAADYLPPLMKAAATTNIGPFLTRATGGLILDPVSGHTYIGDAVTPVAVTGSPNGTNFYRIERLSGTPPPGSTGAVWQTNLFVLAGRVFTGQIPSQMNIDRVSYARDAAKTQIDVFATALPNAVLSISGTGLAATQLTQDVPNTGKFFIDIPGTTLPTGVSITNSLDIPPIIYPVTLVDEINITQASYNPATKNLTIKAASRDLVAPLPTLTVPQFAAPNTLDATGTLVKSLTGTIPPQTVTVHSSKGGTATVPVSVVTPPPVANNDAAVVGVGGSVIINVLANDAAVAPATLDVTSVVASLATRGTVAVNATTGAVTYTPTGLTAGTDTFTYTVKDSNLNVSNAATVTVSIIAAGTAPVAVADTATVTAGGTVPINVIANDTATAPATINPASVAITAATGGTALAGATGTVSYTAPAAPGTYTFSYTVKDNSVPPVTSNPAPVTVTVTGVVANNDSAATVVGTPVTISVLANDTSFGPNIINPASITVFQPAVGGGSVVANAAGTVTYTPPAVAGTFTFGYTVKDNAAVPAGSNLATVTVKVGVAPVAVNDTATALVSSAVTINVIGNDTATLPAAIDPATIAVSTPTGGTAVANANGTVTYTAPAAAGTYEFAYTVKDNAAPPAISKPAVVTVTATASALPPVANNDTAATVLGTPVNINVIANDTATAPAAINPASVVVTVPTGGTAVANANGTVTYTPPALAGTYTFTYTVKDNAVTPLTSNVATVTVTVAAANVAPVAGNDTVSTVTNGTITISVLANDSSTTSTLNPATVVVTQPALGGGTATANATGTVTYAAPAVAGTYTFTYTVRDNAVPALTSNVATVTVTVTAVDIPPTANNDTATATTGGTITINVIANDTSATSTINPASVVVTQPALGGGTATANATGTVTYVAPAVAGTYTFTYTVKDNFVPPATSNIATVTVTVTAPAVAPVAGNNTATMVAGAGASTIINVIANDTATAPATINAASVVIVTQPLNGTAVANLNGTVTYTPAAGFVGTNSFTYNVKDSNGLVSNNATVTVTVNAPVTETLAVTLANFIVAGSEWRVEGTTTARTAGETINIYNGATVAGSPLIGSATVTNGVWKFSLKPGPAANALRRISIQSSLIPPATLEGITLVVR